MFQVLPNKPELFVVEARQFSTSGKFMKLIHTMPNNPRNAKKKVESVRVYKRVN